MLHIITGKTGSGKTTYLHKIIGKLVKEENREVTLLVPRRFTFESDIGILDALGPKDACSVEVLSFFRLAQSVLKTCRGIKKPPVTDGANAIIMQDALDSIKDSLTFYAKHTQNIAFCKNMLEEIKMYKRCLVTPDALRFAAQSVKDDILRKKTLETALIYEAYDAVLSSSYYDDNDLLKIIYGIMLESDFFLGKTIAIDDFSSFSAQELKIIRLMLRRAQDVYVTFCTDDYKNTDVSSPFATVNKACRTLISNAQAANCETADVEYITDKSSGFSTYNSQALNALENSLYKSAYKPYDGDASDVTLFFSPNVREECDYAAATIKRLLREKKYRCRDIAVVYRNESTYQKEIRYSLKKYSVPVFEDKRQPIENEPIIIFVRSLLDLCSGKLSSERILSILKTTLYCTDIEETSQIENYVLMWSIDGDSWKKQWKDNPDGFGSIMDEEKDAQLEKLNEIRERIVAPIESIREKTQDASVKDVIRYIYEFLVENSINEKLKDYALMLNASGSFELAREQQQVWDILMEVFDEIAKTADKRVLKASKIREIFDLVVSNKSLGKLPDGFDEVTVCTPDAMTSIMPKVVFVLGANEGEFPKTNDETGVFSQREREKLNKYIDAFDVSAHRAAADERFGVYNSLCSARQRLYISWSVMSVGGEKLCESEIVTAVRNILPNVKTINTSLVPIIEKIESEKAAFELMAQKWNENSQEARTLKEYFSQKSEYEGKLEAIERACSGKDFSFKSKDTAKDLFGNKMHLSATTFEEYEKCPFKYFCKYAVRAKERTQAKLDPSLNGSLVHYVLENILKKYKNTGIKKEDKKQLLADAKAVLNEFIEKYMGGTSDKSKRFMYLYRRTYKVLTVLIERLVFEFDDSDFIPADFELKIAHNENVKPYKVVFDEGYAEFFGSVDRVDVMTDGDKKYLRVVDYKTGGKEFSLSDVIDGLGAQMLIYLMAICKNGKYLYGENIIPAGVLYFPAKFNAFESGRQFDAQDVEAQKITGGKLSGIVLGDGVVISGMSRSMNGVIMPFGVDKNGRLKGNFISLEELEMLYKCIDKNVREMCSHLLDGKIPARPAYGKNYQYTCDYCEYKSVCMHSEGVKKRKLNDMSYSDSLGYLSLEEKQ